MSNEIPPDSLPKMSRQELEDYARALRVEVEKLTLFVRKVSELATDQTTSPAQCALALEATDLLNN